MAEHPAATSPVRSYRDLRVWQQSMDLAEETYRATEQFPERERYGLVSQLRRAVVIASGSLSEMETQLVLSARLGFLSREQAEHLLEVCDHIGRMLGSLRRSLRARARAPSP